MAEATIAGPLAEGAAQPAKGRFSHALETFAAVLLALGGFSSAWCGFQSALFDGKQNASYAEASALRSQSGKASTAGGQLVNVDVNTFIIWVSAHAAHNEELETFLQRRLRPEFKPVFDEWLATDPFHDSHAPPTPFQLPSYRPAKLEQAQALAEEADRKHKTGDEANARSDYYARNAVLLSLCMFFAGIAQLFKHISVRASVLVLATAFLVMGLVSALSLPRAIPG